MDFDDLKKPCALSVDDLIRVSGGAKAISDASLSSAKPIGVYAVHKWRRNGVPAEHWAVVSDLSGIGIEEIYLVNERLRRGEVDQGLQRRERAQ